MSAPKAKRRSPFIRRLNIQGLKGGSTSIEMTRLSVVIGANGAGKTRIHDAISFLLGRPTAGEKVDGKNVRQLLEGDKMRVLGIVDMDGDDDITIARVRDLSPSGSFGASVFYAQRGDDKTMAGEAEAYVANRLGDLSAPGGPAWLELSDAALRGELAKIGSLTCLDLTERVNHLIRSYPRQLLLQAQQTAPAHLEAGLALAKGELSKARDELKTARASLERSRREANMSADPGLIGRHEEAMAKANERRDAAAQELINAETRHRELIATMRAIGADITAAEARGKQARETIERINRLAMSDVQVPTEQEMAEINDELSAASAAYREANEAISQGGEILSRLRDAASVASSKVRDARANVEHLKTEHENLTNTSDLIKSVPCAKDSEWVGGSDFDCRGVDLCGQCPLLAKARKALDDIRTVGGHLTASVEIHTAAVTDEANARANVTKAERAMMEISARRDESLRRMDAAERRRIIAAHAVQTNMEAITARATADADRAAALAVIAETDALLATLREQARSVNLSVDESRDQVDAAVKANADAKRAADSASDRIREAEQANTKARRLHDDERSAIEATARESAAKELLEQFEQLQRSLLDDGQRAIIGAAQPFLDDPWSVAFRDGRIGLRSTITDAFWSGPALSAAQRIVLGTAIDFALASIYGQQLRIVAVEIDQIDHSARAKLLGELKRRVEAGDIGQVLAMGWDASDYERPYFAGWSRVDVISDRDSGVDIAPVMQSPAAVTMPTAPVMPVMPAEPAASAPRVAPINPAQMTDAELEAAGYPTHDEWAPVRDEDMAGHIADHTADDDDGLGDLFSDPPAPVFVQAAEQPADPSDQMPDHAPDQPADPSALESYLAAQDGPTLKLLLLKFGQTNVKAVDDRRAKLKALCDAGTIDAAELMKGLADG